MSSVLQTSAFAKASTRYVVRPNCRVMAGSASSLTRKRESPVDLRDSGCAKSVTDTKPTFSGKRGCALSAQANQIRGLLAEFGIVLPQGIGHITKCLPAILEDEENELPGIFRQLAARLGAHLKGLDRQVGELEEQIHCWHRESEASRRLAQIPGIGPMTASALVATIGDAKQFKNARQLAAWLGLVPRQHSSGGKPMLLGISKRGDAYLRTLLIHGARSVIRVVERKAEHAQNWLMQLIGRRHKNIATVALANKNARIVWALLAQGRNYQSDYVPLAA